MQASESAYADIFQTYADDSAFLWLLRSHALNQPHYTLEDLAKLEARIQAKIDGLPVAPAVGWPACEGLLAFEDAEGVFVAALVAFRLGDQEKIKQVVDIALAEPRAMPGLISALGWLPDGVARPWIERFLAGKDLQHKYLGIAACSVRRLNPGPKLEQLLARDDCRAEPALYSRMLRLIGELPRPDLLPFLQQAMTEELPEVLFWSSWSAVLLGDQAALDNLLPNLSAPNPYSERTTELVFRVLPVDQARPWISQMAKEPELERTVIRAVAALGDPQALDWLIDKMKQPQTARLAGEAYSQITGVDIVRDKLEDKHAAKSDSGPNDDPEDQNVEMDPDEHLPWPDLAKIAAHRSGAANILIPGQRYFLGRPPTPEWLQSCLQNGYQRQRHAAALEWALAEPGQPLINTYARLKT